MCRSVYTALSMPLCICRFVCAALYMLYLPLWICSMCRSVYAALSMPLCVCRLIYAVCAALYTQYLLHLLYFLHKQLCMYCICCTYCTRCICCIYSSAYAALYLLCVPRTMAVVVLHRACPPSTLHPIIVAHVECGGWSVEMLQEAPPQPSCMHFIAQQFCIASNMDTHRHSSQN